MTETLYRQTQQGHDCRHENSTESLYHMLLVKRKFVVKGVVQRVGYRAFVLQVASNLGIKGTITNLADGTVEIFADGAEDALRRFKAKIGKKGDPEDFTRIHVSEIKEIPEGQLKWPDKEFRGFEIDYGFEPTTGYERTTLEDLEIMKMGAGFLRDDMTVFAVNTAAAFGTVFERYGSFSKDMGEVRDTLVELKDVIGDFSKRYFEQNGKKPLRKVRESKPSSRKTKRRSR